MSAAAWYVLVYGVLVAAGGVMGYVKAESLVSLVVGGLTGIGLVVLGVFMGQKKKWAAPAALALSALVLFYSANRFFAGPSYGPNPPVSMVALVGLSSVAVLVLLARILHRSGKR